MVVLVPVEKRKGDAAGLVSLTCSTDNQGNSFLLDKMLTTRYPLGIVLMELAHQMKLRRMVLRARWLPRLQNQEADDLTNEEFRHYDPKRRIHVELKSPGLEVMDALFAAGDDYMSDLEKAKAFEMRKEEMRKQSGEKRTERKAAKGSKLRDTDPWV